MKAKLLFSVIVLFSFLENGFSQAYHPLLENPSWVVSDWVSCCRPPIVATIDQGIDAPLGVHIYKKFIDPFPNSDSSGVLLDTIYLREDIDTQKVYKIVNDADFLLYDFSLENGDTFSQYGFEWLATVDDFAVNGGVRKRITLNSITLYHGNSLKQVWIEGVGTTAHPFYPDYNMYAVVSSGGGYRVNTRCSFQNSGHVFGNVEFCGTTALATTNNVILNQNIVFSPNPFAAELIINSNQVLQDATFQLYTLQGQLVREDKNLNGKTIIVRREKLSSGMYFAQLHQKGHLVKVAKLFVD